MSEKDKLLEINKLKSLLRINNIPFSHTSTQVSVFKKKIDDVGECTIKILCNVKAQIVAYDEIKGTGGLEIITFDAYCNVEEWLYPISCDDAYIKILRKMAASQ